MFNFFKRKEPPELGGIRSRFKRWLNKHPQHFYDSSRLVNLEHAVYNHLENNCGSDIRYQLGNFLKHLPFHDLAHFQKSDEDEIVKEYKQKILLRVAARILKNYSN